MDLADDKTFYKEVFVMARGLDEIRKGHGIFPDGICPICGHQGWCCTISTDDGAMFVVCKRDTAKQDVGNYKYIKDTNKEKSSMFLYKEGNKSKYNNYNNNVKDIKFIKTNEIKRFPDNVLDKLNHKLLSMLEIKNEHRQMLKAEKFTDEMIEKYQIKSYPDMKERWSIARALSEYAEMEFGSGDLTGFPGAYIAESKSGNRYWSLSGYEGTVFNITNAYGEIVMLQIRLDNPFPGTGKYRVLSSEGTKKDGSPMFQNGCTPNSRIGIFEPAVMGDTYAAYFTEGVKKAIKVVETLGCICITVQGVNSWSELLEVNEKGERIIDVLKKYGVKMLIMAYDGDRFKNKYVKKAQKDVIKVFKDEGFYMAEAYWDSYMGKGIDDILNNGYKPMFAVI